MPKHQPRVRMSNVRGAHRHLYRQAGMADLDWYSPVNMALWGTSLPRFAYIASGGYLFVTGDAPGSDSERRYTLRYQHAATGVVETVGTLCQHKTQAAAMKEMWRLLDEGWRPPTGPTGPQR